MTLIVVGSVGIDTVETPHGRAENVVGGSSVYFSLAASHFTKVRLAANIGSDFPDQAWAALRERGADLDGIQSFDDQPTFRWSGKYEGNMNEAETLLTELNVLAEPPAIPTSYVGSPFVFLANMGPDVQLQALETLKGKVVFGDTMNLWIDIQREALLRVMKRLDGLILNDAEARELTGQSNLILAGEALLQMGPDIIVVKKGEHGATLFTKDFHFALPAFPTKCVVDPTGAGDSFAGGMLGYLAHHKDLSPASLRRAMVYGTAAASLTVEAFSTQALTQATRKDLDERFEQLVHFVRV